MHPISPEQIKLGLATLAAILFMLLWHLSSLNKMQREMNEDDSRTAAGRVNNPYYFKQVDHE